MKTIQLEDIKIDFFDDYFIFNSIKIDNEHFENLLNILDIVERLSKFKQIFDNLEIKNNLFSIKQDQNIFELYFDSQLLLTGDYYKIRDLRIELYMNN